MNTAKIRRSLAFGTMFVCVSLFPHHRAAADSRKSTVTVTVTVSPSCKIDANGVNKQQCSGAAQPITATAPAAASAGAAAATTSIRTINF